MVRGGFFFLPVMKLSKYILNLCKVWAQLNGLKYLDIDNLLIDIILMLNFEDKITNQRNQHISCNSYFSSFLNIMQLQHRFTTVYDGKCLLAWMATYNMKDKNSITAHRESYLYFLVRKSKATECCSYLSQDESLIISPFQLNKSLWAPCWARHLNFKAKGIHFPLLTVKTSLPKLGDAQGGSEIAQWQNASRHLPAHCIPLQWMDKKGIHFHG